MLNSSDAESLKPQGECFPAPSSDPLQSPFPCVSSNRCDRLDSLEDLVAQDPICHPKISEFVVLLDVTGKIGYISPAIHSILGYTAEMVQGKWVHDFVHPEDHHRLVASLKGSPDLLSPQEYRVLDNQGCWRLIEALRTNLPITLGGGLAIACRPVATPQTTIAALYCRMFETMHDGVIVTDLEGRIVDWNPAAERIFGYGKREVLGRTPAFLHPPDVATHLTPQILDALKRHGRWTGEIGFLRKDGTEGICETVIVLLHDTTGRRVFTLGVNRDITDRKQMEDELREDRDFVTAVLEMAGALVLVIDCQGRIVRFNRACESMTQYTAEEVKGKCVWDLFLIPQELEAIKEVFAQLLSTCRSIEYENHWQAKDGSRHLISWSNTVLRDRDGKVKYVIATGLDLTEHQRLEAIRCDLQKEQELSQLQSHFFTMASHQFRTPLSTILLSAHSLENSAYNGSISKALTNIHRIQVAARSLTHTLGDILTISRAETGHLEFDPNPLDLDIFCWQILAKTRRDLGSHHQFRFNTRGNVNGIVLDENLMRILMENLLSNAIQYSPENSIIDLILVGSLRSVKILVRDQGLGILSSDLPHVFNAFFRGSNVSDIPGVGLGLTVVKKCVELHGGQITLTAGDGAGTTATVKIPRG